jgi:hypothetical protein
MKNLPNLTHIPGSTVLQRKLCYFNKHVDLFEQSYHINFLYKDY